MKRPVFSIITLSYDKIEYVFDAISSVLNQTFSSFEYYIVDSSVKHKEQIWDKIHSYNDPRIKLVYEEVTDEDRQKHQISAFLINKYYEKSEGKYAIVLCDDDFFYGNCLETHHREHQNHPEIKAFYHAEFLFQEKKHIGMRFPGVIFDENQSPDCHIDGGAVSIKTRSLQLIEKPWYPIDFVNKKHADGVFLEKFAKKFPIHPINEVLGAHRFTSVGAWDPK
jgi:glycosyltransferase involved in cell wall biosynthesis